ncbi:MAG: TonB-dependent receptor [Bacteroidales bacterium]|nr:TonB-dependent receptor [Bacteroidales bacterium]
MKKRILLFAAITAMMLGTAEQGQAQTSVVAQDIVLEDVIITANRVAVKRADVPQKIEVISSSDIQNTNSNDVADLLHKKVGVDIIRYPGMMAGIGIRGFRPEFSGLSQKTLILIDGRPAAVTNIALLDQNSIERIEVLKGPASAVYGSQAMGGVINIITRKSEGTIHGNVTAAYGSFDNKELSARVGGSLNEKLHFDLSMGMNDQGKDYRMGKDNIFRGLLNQENVSSWFGSNDSTAVTDDTRGDGEVRKHTQFSRYNSRVRLAYDINNSWNISTQWDGVVGKNVQLPGNISDGDHKPALKDLNRFSGDVVVMGKVGTHAINAKAYYGQEAADNYTLYEGYSQPELIDPYHSFSELISWKGAQLMDVKYIGSHFITMGMDYNSASYTSERFNKTGESIAPYRPNYSLNTSSVYGQANLNYLNSRLSVNAGLRYDRIGYQISQNEIMQNKETDAINGVVSPSAGVQYKLIPELAVKTSFGKGFSPANIFHLAGFDEKAIRNKPGHAILTKGNLDLKNLESTNWDLGVVFNKGSFKSEVTLFNTWYKNNSIEMFITPESIQLTSVGDTIDKIITYKNANYSRIQGCELSASYDFAGFDIDDYSLNVSASLEHIFKAKEIADEYGVGEMERKMLNVADNTVRFAVDYKCKRGFSAGLSGRYIEGRYDRNWNFYGEYVELGYADYLLMDAYMSYSYKDQHRFTLYCNNLTDENYYEKYGYNMSGRSLMLKYNFNF